MATKLAKDWLKASLSDLMNIEAILGLHGKPTIEDSKEFYEFALEVFKDVCLRLEVDRNELIG
ncbi:MAG: hypothetical protein KU38_08460 [Sulfurovum sp. FS08-3]|nr:MAG: hypothetical protein KU38_08460 [Sulfurovum sp. FS08-3]